MQKSVGDQLYADELYADSVNERSARRPMLKTASLIAIAALGLGGLYQGYRFTFREDGPAPRYAWSTPTQPPAVPEAQTASTDPVAPATRPRVELADNDDAQPSQANGPPSAPATVTAIIPVDRAALIPASASSQQGITFDQPAPAAGPAPDPQQP